MPLHLLPPTISESDFTDVVIEIAMLRGWQVAHFRPCRTDKGWRTLMQGHVGYPDLTMARRGLVIFAELKTMKGRVSPSQRTWLDTLPNAYLWRPADLDEIRKVLR